MRSENRTRCCCCCCLDRRKDLPREQIESILFMRKNKKKDTPPAAPAQQHTQASRTRFFFFLSTSYYLQTTPPAESTSYEYICTLFMHTCRCQESRAFFFFFRISPATKKYQEHDGDAKDVIGARQGGEGVLYTYCCILPVASIYQQRSRYSSCLARTRLLSAQR